MRHLLPRKPLDAFWDKLGDGVEKRRKTYRAGHSLMGARLALAADLKYLICKSLSSHSTEADLYDAA